MEVSYSSDSGEGSGIALEHESNQLPQFTIRNLTPSWLSTPPLALTDSAAVAGAMKVLHTRIAALERSNSDLTQQFEAKQCELLHQKDELLSETLVDKSEKSNRIAGLEYSSDLLESEIITVEAKETAWEEVITALETKLERVSMETADVASAQSEQEARLLTTWETVVLEVAGRTEALDRLDKHVKKQEQELETLETDNRDMRRAVERVKRDISGVKSANEELNRVLEEEINRKEEDFGLTLTGLRETENQLTLEQTQLESKNEALQEQIAMYKSEIEKAKRAPYASTVRNANETRSLTLRIPELSQVSFIDEVREEQGTAQSVVSKISAVEHEIRVLSDKCKKMLLQVNSSSAIEAASSAVDSLTSLLEDKSRALLSLKRKQQELIRSQVIISL